MPLYLDVHSAPGVSPDEVARAHAADVEIQSRYGVEYTKYWLNEAQGKIYCLCHAPSVDAATRVHREAHGMEAEKLIEVDPDLVDGLLGGGAVSQTGAAILATSPREQDPGTRIVMFTDIVGSTAFTQKFGDRAAMDMLAVHDTAVRLALMSNAGREVKHTGDGIMASFVSARSAVRCARDIQQRLARSLEGGKFELRLRIGAAAGAPIEHNNDIFGSTVQLAARLCAHAEPSQSLASSAVADLCPEEPLRSLGEVDLKGFENPVRVHVID